MDIKEIECPDCGSGETGDLDCSYCLGNGRHPDDDDEYCEHCDGCGYVEGTRECFDCGNEFDA